MSDEYGGMFIVILAIGCFVFLLIALFWSAGFVSPSNCRVCKGTFGVTPASQGSILNTCGADGKQPCSFISTSLVDATSQCSSDPMCTSFTYDELGGIFYYNLNDTIIPGSVFNDVYFKL
jgi:hypothetical protein